MMVAIGKPRVRPLEESFYERQGIDIPTEVVARDAQEIDESKLVDPYVSGYNAGMQRRPRRPRECYMKNNDISKEKREIWFCGYDDAVVDAKAQGTRDLTAYQFLTSPRRRN